ncbi:MAG: hypothetical protein PHR35_05885 [Kiritimatiellae bacterium]|nr:hypothetical protein [Kiritimatiellia bacterium]
MVARAYNESLEDLERHEELEGKRLRAGLPTDMQRYLSGGEVRD